METYGNWASTNSEIKIFGSNVKLSKQNNGQTKASPEGMTMYHLCLMARILQ
jgi:hypothetical protein